MILNGFLLQGSFDDPCHFEETATPLLPDIFKGKPTNQLPSMNLAQLAMSTLGVSDRQDEVSFVILFKFKPNGF